LIFNDSFSAKCLFNTKDVPIGGVEGVAPPNISLIARKLVKRQPCWKRVGNSNFCDPFLLTMVGQLVKTPPPPTEGASAHHCLTLRYCPRGVSLVNKCTRIKWFFYFCDFCGWFVILRFFYSLWLPRTFYEIVRVIFPSILAIKQLYLYYKKP